MDLDCFVSAGKLFNTLIVKYSIGLCEQEEFVCHQRTADCS